ncbi:photosystem I reaction centre subunit XI PsaL [Candidatus Gracilibacteria bacterium]|nr:photosystem I reaction centre subunit XI PsaL [Candidatus Gracilibacteria bacterium]NJM87965.1 photosystem I reaction centre subunit XI PsaL [Hydrococcus sp. RU_2_2]NJP19269.1 photosystem I reaction centre subunit XI PsaL [Hydrococcus sp. CRU_1_1]
MTTFVDKIERSNSNPRDPRNREVVFAADSPYNGNLATPINSSPLVKTFINNLPAYRPGLTPLRRGLEVGLAHGYWLVGPFFEFNPMRFNEYGSLIALLSTVSLILISTLAISLYAGSNPPAPTVTITTPNPPKALADSEGWNEYASGFFIGGVGGAILAYAILSNIDVFGNFLNIVGL